MFLAFASALPILFAAIAAIAALTGLALSKTGVSSKAGLDTQRRIRLLYGIAALLGLGFALLAFVVFPTVYVNAVKVPGLLAALAPALAGTVFVVTAGVGESFWPKPEGQQRGAFLTRRPVLANAARVPAWAAVTWGSLLLAFLVFCGFAATSDGESAGRSIAHPEWSPYRSGGSGPFPGWPYGIPMLICSAVLILLAIGVLHVIARRPAVSGTTPEEDAQLRRTSATSLMKGVQLSLAVSLAGVLAIAGQAATHGGVIEEDGYFATLAGHWWAYPVIVAAPIVLITAIVIAARRKK